MSNVGVSLETDVGARLEITRYNKASWTVAFRENEGRDVEYFNVEERVLLDFINILAIAVDLDKWTGKNDGS